MARPRKPVRTDDGLVHFEARNITLLLCRNDVQHPAFVYVPVGTIVTCVRCLWHADVFDALRDKPKAVQSFRDALP